VSKVTVREIARQVVWMSGLSSHEEWGASLGPPQDIIDRTHEYLDILASKIMGKETKEAVAHLLNGHVVAMLLKVG
jgi:hypothetical protein